MALTPASRARFDIRFVAKPPEDCCCPICLCVMNDPHLTSCCSQHYCQTCIARIQGMGQPCPMCKRDEFSTLFNRQLRNRISTLDVFCPMEGKGCKWKGKYEDLEGHLSVGKIEGECSYISVPCPFECGHSFLRLQLKRHMTKDCKNRQGQCRLCYDCGASGSADKHSANCPNREVRCPNGCPITKIRFCDLDEHTRQLCPYREVKCKFHSFGCKEVMKFKDTSQHYVHNTSTHLDMIRKAALGLSNLEQMYAELAEKNANLESEHEQLKEKVAVFESRCDEYESSLSELREMMQSLRLSQGPPPPPLSSLPSSRNGGSFSPPPEVKGGACGGRRLSAEQNQTMEKDPFCFRP